MDTDIFDRERMDALVPHEHTLNAVRIRQYMQRIHESKENNGYAHPLPIIRLGDGDILCEGHHTLAALYLLNRAAKVFVLRTDQDVVEYSRRFSSEDYVSGFDNFRDLTFCTRSKIMVANDCGVYAFPEIKLKFPKRKLLRLDDSRTPEEIFKLEVAVKSMAQSH